jgi:Xaa-Pro dipeptidase
LGESKSAEVRGRSQIVREFLSDYGLAAWLAWRPDELVMITGHMPHWGASALLYFKDQKPILFVPEIEPRDHIPDGLEVREYPWGRLECADPFGVLVEAIRVALEKAGVKPERAGAYFGAARTALPMQAAEQNPFAEDFSSRIAEIVAKPDAQTQSAFLGLYLLKTDEEVRRIRRANRVAGIGLQAFFGGLSVGATETCLASLVETVIHAQIGQDGIFHSRGWATVQAGPHSADAGRFNRSSARRLQDGDLVLIELATCVNGYWSDLTRTVAVGALSAELGRVLSLTRNAQEAAIAAVRPGAAAGEIDGIARGAIAQQGLAAHLTHGTGHHVGFRYHDPGFGLVPGAQEKLQAGMIVTIEPGVYVAEYGGGARIEDNVLVTESGHKVLSQDSQGPERVPQRATQRVTQR